MSGPDDRDDKAPAARPAETARAGTVGGSATVNRVLAGELCTGCGLCASVSAGIVMGSAPPGYNRPVQTGPVSAAEERLIAAACPGVVVHAWPSGGRVHPYWGPCQTVATGFATEPAVRFQGSSGGAITAFAIHALQSGIAERVVHVTADPARSGRQHDGGVGDAAEDGAWAGAGSRYVSSSPLADIDRLLAEPGAFVFIGKPCDVSALRRLGEVDPRVAAKVPLMLAFFCAGIPSRDAVGRVLAKLEVEPRDLATFRYRGNGWPGQASAVTRDGRVAEMSYEESWGGFLSHEVQFRCKICPDAVGGVADIACADAWYGGESGYPSFEELEGRSLVLSRTARGQGGPGQRATSRRRGRDRTPRRRRDRADAAEPGARRKRLIAARTAAVRMSGACRRPRQMDGPAERRARPRGGARRARPCGTSWERCAARSNGKLSPALMCRSEPVVASVSLH